MPRLGASNKLDTSILSDIGRGAATNFNPANMLKDTNIFQNVPPPIPTLKLDRYHSQQFSSKGPHSNKGGTQSLNSSFGQIVRLENNDAGSMISDEDEFFVNRLAAKNNDNNLDNNEGSFILQNMDLETPDARSEVSSPIQTFGFRNQ